MGQAKSGAGVADYQGLIDTVARKTLTSCRVAVSDLIDDLIVGAVKQNAVTGVVEFRTSNVEDDC